MPGWNAAGAPGASTPASATSMSARFTDTVRQSRYSEQAMTACDTAFIERRVRELGRWFHNMNLGGVQTAPDHFLGDYPAMKWQRFADAIPQNLDGRSVLDVGC